MREGIGSGGAVLGVDESDMEKALKGVATEPKSERSGGTLGDRGEENGGGDYDEGHVPDHVDYQDRLGIGAAGFSVGGSGNERESVHGGAAEYPISADLALLFFQSFLHFVMSKERERESVGLNKKRNGRRIGYFILVLAFLIWIVY